MELNARRPAGDKFASPWYTGDECSHAPEPGPYRQWREARSDWVMTQRPEDLERMLAVVTPDNPPLASDIHRRNRRAAVGWSPAAPMPGVVALTAAVISVLAAAAVLMLGAAFVIIFAVIQGWAWLVRPRARCRGGAGYTPIRVGAPSWQRAAGGIVDTRDHSNDSKAKEQDERTR